MSVKTISLTGAALFVGGVIFLAGNHSVPSQTYTCDGFTSLNGAAGEQDQGRLQLVFPSFWVQFAKSDGYAAFQSAKFSPLIIKFKISNDGNQTWYNGNEGDTTFSLKRGANDLRIEGPQMMFVGNCILAL